jgi:hypothetical protein
MSCVSHCHLAAILPISGRIVIHYRWHPLYGKARVASRLNGAQRASSCTSSWLRAS